MKFEPALTPEVSAPPSLLIVVSGKSILASTDCMDILVPAEQFSTAAAVYQHHLGKINGQALDLVVVEGSQHTTTSRWDWVPLRSTLGVMDEMAFQLAGKALQLANWHDTHQFCGRCGNPTMAADQCRSRHCPQCDLHFYPRVSPCVIGLVNDQDRCLLARNAKHPAGKFSTIAGFIEPGETAEQAFAREVYEEVGVRVSNVRYAFSQPWPFPGQLMLGFYAEYAGNPIRVDGEEILEAHWFDIDSLPEIPSESTISGQLIREFVRKRKG